VCASIDLDRSDRDRARGTGDVVYHPVAAFARSAIAGEHGSLCAGRAGNLDTLWEIGV